MKYICHMFLITIVLYILNVNSMALKGPALIRYDPCGLGVIHFDRLHDRYWQGVVNFGLYSNLIEAQMEIYFEKEVKLFGAQHTNFAGSRKDYHNFILKFKGGVPQRYVFHLTIDNLELNETDVPNVSKLTLNNVTLCSDDIKALQNTNSLNVTDQFTDKYYAHVCGRRSINNTELVSVRTEARPGDWPWHVAILIKDPVTGVAKYDCGGNVISRTAILTAGHCVNKHGITLEPQQVVVVAGVNNYKDLYQIGRQTFIALQIILHPSYDDEYATSDLAIVKVDRLRFTDYVQPICIWGPVYDKTNLSGKEATMVGFGSTEDNKQADVLRSSYTMVQNDSTCVHFSSKIYKKLMNEFTFCAGYGPASGVNPRNGDSGGGLVVPTMQVDHKISWFLRGVLSKCGVSPGQKQCDPTYYVVYTDVGPHYGWIYHNSGLEFRSNVKM